MATPLDKREEYMIERERQMQEQLAIRNAELEHLKRDLADLEYNLQSIMNSMSSRPTNMMIATHQHQHQHTMTRRPGFFREDLRLDKHVSAVMARAEQQGVSNTLNYKNWVSMVNAYTALHQQTIADVKRIVFLVNQSKTMARLVTLAGITPLKLGPKKVSPVPAEEIEEEQREINEPEPVTVEPDATEEDEGDGDWEEVNDEEDEE